MFGWLMVVVCWLLWSLGMCCCWVFGVGVLMCGKYVLWCIRLWLWWMVYLIWGCMGCGIVW